MYIRIVLAVIAAGFMVTKALEPNFGFSTVGGSEAAGYNIFTVMVYALGAWLIYRALRKKPTSAE